jgi:2-polyprenyl-6-methoxyphenol hydroxylase-like FAD-dependent oxidoreductase
VRVDVAVIGGGLAGSAAAVALGRAGVSTILVDPHVRCPPAFRCEKLDESQLELLDQCGLSDVVLSAATTLEEIWVARFGRLVAKRRSKQVGISYDVLVNEVRDAVPACVQFVKGTAAAITRSAERQTISLSSGEQISARLVVVASGISESVRRNIGITRKAMSPCHSISIGFNVEPGGRSTFDFPALTYYPEHVRDKLAYLTLFPIGSTMRANLFTYRSLRDPWLRNLREAPKGTLLSAMPRLSRLMGDFRVSDEIKVRPVDLYTTQGYRQPGVVLVGDAFATSCPAAGTGVNKVLTDVGRLCQVHIPRWLSSEGMHADKIDTFYDDPIKQACDAHSAEKARQLRALSTNTALKWKTQRLVRFVGQIGVGGAARARTALLKRNPPSAPLHAE